jgi:Skp family chaperone for outer membrane proteins
MRKHILLPILLLLISTTFFAQTSRGVKIGYIDMEYILQNVPDYIEAKNQLEQKAQKWKQEIETKKNEIARLKDALKTEQVLLTKELTEEREEEIAFQESELLAYQQKRFGPNGDLITQKAVLTQPIQDQVFTAAQDIAEIKKYDFIFDKSSDLTMLFANKRFDISDQVVRAITRSSKRNQLNKKELKEEAALEAKEDMIDENPTLSERQKALDEKKLAREKLVASMKLAAEQKRIEALEKKQKALAEREAKKSGTTVAVKTETENTKGTATDSTKTTANTEAAKADTTKKKEANDAIILAKQKIKEEREATLATRKKALEDKKKKVLEEREAAKKAKEEKANESKTN